MTINTDNDEVEVYHDALGTHRWRRVDTSNGKVVSSSGEGYVNADYCEVAAETYNPGVPVVHI